MGDMCELHKAEVWLPVVVKINSYLSGVYIQSRVTTGRLPRRGGDARETSNAKHGLLPATTISGNPRTTQYWATLLSNPKGYKRSQIVYQSTYERPNHASHDAEILINFKLQ